MTHIYGAKLVSIIIHTKDTMHTCEAQFTCMKPNSQTLYRVTLGQPPPMDIYIYIYIYIYICVCVCILGLGKLTHCYRVNALID